MTDKKFNATLSEVLKIGEDTITDETSPDNVATWDSMNALLLVTALETAYNIRFTARDIVGVKNVGDIKESLKRHGVNLSA
ncbi:MAG: acyl carrier protein [Thermodesulfovibrionia bacterium]|nr:acyl carrier protein [Thermodesulfovibrionia bacterium]